jgi:TRAP-type mannitol/chloroaromatic compound transport system permease small subunit
LLRFIDRASEYCGKFFAWLIVPLVFGLVYEAIARYAFNAPTRWAYDLSYMFYAAIFWMGAAYALSRNKHVRVDVLYRHFSPRWQGIVDACLYLVLFFPPMVVLLVKGTQWAIASWSIREVSATGMWRPPLYPLKTVVPVAVAMLLLQGIAQFIRAIHLAIGKGKPSGT